jgi:rare lipoprotein A
MRILAVLIALAALAGCGHKRSTRSVPPPPRPARVTPIPVEVGHTETGVASWYGNPYHGRQAANGETYDMEKMTAAHRTMPFNTWVRVYDLDNGKTTDVRITDRGPFVGGRIIDLSRAAARELEMIGPGTARVRLEVIRAPETLPTETQPVATFAVQVGAYRNRGNAEIIRMDMEKRFGMAQVVPNPKDTTTWRVLVGNEATEDAANALAGRIRQESPEKIDCFVIRLDII